MSKFYFEQGRLCWNGSLKTDSVRQALEWSIKKWEVTAIHQESQDGQKVPGGNINAYSCPLCIMFFWRGCDGCPVRDRTGRRRCTGTPYILFCESFQAKDAWAEAEFLKGLRGEVER